MAQRREHATMQENYFIKRQRDLKESKEAKTGHAKRALKESMDPTALEGELRKALNNQGIEHCGDAYDEDGNEVMMFGDSAKGTAEAIAKYLKGKGFAGVSVDKDDGAARDGGTAWFAVVNHDSKAKMTEGTNTEYEGEADGIKVLDELYDTLKAEMDDFDEKFSHATNSYDKEYYHGAKFAFGQAALYAQNAKRDLMHGKAKKKPMSMSSKINESIGRMDKETEKRMREDKMFADWVNHFQNVASREGFDIEIQEEEGFHDPDGNELPYACYITDPKKELTYVMGHFNCLPNKNPSDLIFCYVLRNNDYIKNSLTEAPIGLKMCNIEELVNLLKDIIPNQNETSEAEHGKPLNRTKKVKTLLGFYKDRGESKSSIVRTIELNGGDHVKVVEETDDEIIVVFYATYDEMSDITDIWDFYFDYESFPEFFPDHEPEEGDEDNMNDTGAEFYDLWQLKKKYGIIQDSKDKSAKVNESESNPTTGEIRKTMEKVAKDLEDAYNKIYAIRKNLTCTYDDINRKLADEEHADIVKDVIAKLDGAMELLL